MLYTDIYKLIISHLSLPTVPAFTASCKEFRQLFWDSVDLTEDDCLPLRRAAMRGALTSLKTMLPLFRGTIPVEVLKLAMLAGTEVALLLLQYDVEVDEGCLAFAIQLRDPKLFGVLLQKARRPILHYEHILTFLSLDGTEEFPAIVRASPQFRTLVINHRISSFQYEEQFPELLLYRKSKEAVRRFVEKYDLSSMGIDSTAPLGDRIEKVRAIKKNIEANWIVNDINIYLMAMIHPTISTVRIEPDTINDYLLQAVWKGEQNQVRSIIAERGDKFSYRQKLYLFDQASEEICRLFLKSGFVELTPEIVGILYHSRYTNLLHELWLNNEAVPTLATLEQYPQEIWFIDVVKQVCLYWRDVEQTRTATTDSSTDITNTEETTATA